MNNKIELTTAKLRDPFNAIHCVVCDRVSEGPLVVAHGKAEGQGVIICPHCLCDGGIDAKLNRQATGLEARARWLRALIGRLKLPSPAVLKEFASPQEIERAAIFWGEVDELLELDLPIDQAARRAAGLLAEYRGLWPLIKSDAEADPERGKALAAALAKRREFFGPGADQ